MQVQYEFIHHALSELVVCGETEVTASSLKTFTKGLKVRDGITESQKHYQVCAPSPKLTCKDKIYDNSMLDLGDTQQPKQ